MCGVLCVMTPGKILMPAWCVNSWVILFKVSKHASITFINNKSSLHSPNEHFALIVQVQKHSAVLILVLGPVQSILMVLIALVMRVASLTAHIVLLLPAPMATYKMQE